MCETGTERERKREGGQRDKGIPTQAERRRVHADVCGKDNEGARASRF